MKNDCVDSHHAANADSVAAQAPISVVRRQKIPIQKAMEIIVETAQKISSPFGTSRTHSANATPQPTTAIEAIRPTKM